jgi:hypothetical protein
MIFSVVIYSDKKIKNKGLTMGKKPIINPNSKDNNRIM